METEALPDTVQVKLMVEVTEVVGLLDSVTTGAKGATTPPARLPM